MLKDTDLKIFYSIIFAYVGINIFCFTQEIYWATLLPILFIAIWVLFYQTDKIILLLSFLTPLSVKYTFENFGISVSLPTEPIMVTLLGLFILKLILQSHLDQSFLRHPLTIAILINLTWMLVSACFSSMFIVSIKAFVARLWFVVIFYILTYIIFKKKNNIKWFIWLMIASISLVILYSLRRHYINDWWQLYANYAPKPYFAGHGDYAAVISLFIPFLIAFFVKPSIFGLNRFFRNIAFLTTLLYLIGTVFSFTRAAWLGLVGSVVLTVIFYFRISFKTVLLTGVICLGLFIAFQTQIVMILEANKEVSASDFEQHVESISNISTDASNTERINRWMSALRMFQERPIFGWGPGTYMFQYAPFQLSHEKTIISTNAGNLGNAHSEYIGPLAEMGIIGGVSVLAIVLISLQTAFRLVYRGLTPFIKITALATILGLFTYYIHGTINNYLDTDKAAVPVFAFLSILTCLDLYHNKQKEEAEEVSIL